MVHDPVWNSRSNLGPTARGVMACFKTPLHSCHSMPRSFEKSGFTSCRHSRPTFQQNCANSLRLRDGYTMSGSTKKYNMCTPTVPKMPSSHLQSEDWISQQPPKYGNITLSERMWSLRGCWWGWSLPANADLFPQHPEQVSRTRHCSQKQTCQHHLAYRISGERTRLSRPEALRGHSGIFPPPSQRAC